MKSSRVFGATSGFRDDVGCIEITTLHKEEGVFEAPEVLDIAAAESEAVLDWKQATLGDFSGLSSDFLEEGVAIRQWYVAHGPMLLFVTYSCDEDNRGMDDAAVGELLDTLQLLA